MDKLKGQVFTGSGDEFEEIFPVNKVVAADVAACIINESKTLGLMAALLSSWAATVYAGEAPMDEGLC